MADEHGKGAHRIQTQTEEIKNTSKFWQLVSKAGMTKGIWVNKKQKQATNGVT